MDWTVYDRLADGKSLICGVDEAGRGPLAGPVFAAAVILPYGIEIEGLNDSKKISEKKREMLFDEIIEKAVTYAITSVDNEKIDEINILEATLLAMRTAVSQLDPLPELALVDGNHARGFDIPAKPVIKGDALVPSISAASILAKVSRDRFCIEMDEKYPEYGFKKHKGYGTKLHCEKLLEHGPCPLHRASFLKKILP